MFASALRAGAVSEESSSSLILMSEACHVNKMQRSICFIFPFHFVMSCQFVVDSYF